MTSRIIFILVITITATTLVFSAGHRRPSFVDCQSSEECPKGSCCTLQPTRYSIPTCTRMVQEGETCKPGKTIINTTLYYPNGIEVDVWNVHYVMCPCADGLTCSRGNNTKCKRVSSNEV